MIGDLNKKLNDINGNKVLDIDPEGKPIIGFDEDGEPVIGDLEKQLKDNNGNKILKFDP